MSLWVKLILFVMVFAGAWRFCEKKTSGFTITSISSELPYDPAWETRPLTVVEESSVRDILKQKFTFLANGGQCWAFVSADGEYVLKFFKLHRRRPDILIRLPLPAFLEPYRQKKIASKRVKLVRDFGSYALSFNALQEETALVYVHLNKTAHLNQKITLTDRLGIEHTFDLDTKEFVLQKKVDLVYETFDELMQSKEEEKAKKRIDALIELIVLRCKKGIFDEDAYISRNFGFLGEKAIILDAGRLRKDLSQMEPRVYKNELFTITNRFKLWLEQHHPSLITYLEERRNAVE
jgi:hypothetical protein